VVWVGAAKKKTGTEKKKKVVDGYGGRVEKREWLARRAERDDMKERESEKFDEELYVRYVISQPPSNHANRECAPP